MKTTNFKLFAVIFASAFILLSCAEVKQSGREVGHATRDATKAIGHGTRNITREIGHSTRNVVKAVGEEVKRVSRSKPKSKQ